jgi:hypothetical protein
MEGERRALEKGFQLSAWAENKTKGEKRGESGFSLSILL